MPDTDTGKPFDTFIYKNGGMYDVNIEDGEQRMESTYRVVTIDNGRAYLLLNWRMIGTEMPEYSGLAFLKEDKSQLCIYSIGYGNSEDWANPTSEITRAKVVKAAEKIDVCDKHSRVIYNRIH